MCLALLIIAVTTAAFDWKSGRMTAVREGKWKLARNGKKVELYDLPADLGESNNLAAKHPEVVKRLSQLSEAYWRSLKK